MANEETVTKVVEGVDRLFDEIVVNGRTVKSAPARQSAVSTPVSTNQSEPPVQGEYVEAIQLNNILHDIKDTPLTQEVLAIQQTINTLQGRLNDLVTSVGNINSKIPVQASAQNQLADKNFVNSSIATNTANFLGTYSTLAEIEAIPNPTNNDYAFLETADSSGNNVYDRYKYSAEDSEWLFEYELNNSSFTAEQWATINSGITEVTDTVQSGNDNPVSSDAVYEALQNVTITATGNPVGTIISTYKKIQPRNYLYCDGSTFDETIYPALYLYLGTNVLPDYRECAMVGAEKNTTDVFDSTETNPSTGLPGTQNHDVYTQGQFKDDQLQYHNHALLNQNPSSGAQSGYTVNSVSMGFYGNAYTGTTGNYGAAGRSGSTTHGKRKAVYYYIKAVDGVDISDEDTFLNTVKNYVDGKNSFGLDEVPTGGVWIDGKPIYRKVITINALPNNAQTGYQHDITNIDEFITIRGIAKSSTLSLPIPFIERNGTTNIQLYASASGFTVSTNYDASSYVGKFVFEYTKTTD